MVLLFLFIRCKIITYYSDCSTIFTGLDDYLNFTYLSDRSFSNCFEVTNFIKSLKPGDVLVYHNGTLDGTNRLYYNNSFSSVNVIYFGIAFILILSGTIILFTNINLLDKDIKKRSIASFFSMLKLFFFRPVL